VREHILNRHGVKWPPGFFNGQCFCCTPPPPPPPPPFRYYRPYYGYGYGTTGLVPNLCWFCGDGLTGGPVANKWQLEVEAPYGVTPPAPCGATSAGTDDICNNAAGTFILSRGPFYEQSSLDMFGDTLTDQFCTWYSPSFDWYSTFAIPSPPFGLVYCYGCRQSKAYYHLTLQRYINKTQNIILRREARLNIYYSTDLSDWYTRWYPAAGPDQFDCLGSNVMSLDADTFHFGGDADPQSPFCCDGVDQNVLLIPIE
jgi:hypothetical protein